MSVAKGKQDQHLENIFKIVGPRVQKNEISENYSYSNYEVKQTIDNQMAYTVTESGFQILIK
jgi:hypothetical protein